MSKYIYFFIYLPQIHLNVCAAQTGNVTHGRKERLAVRGF